MGLSTSDWGCFSPLCDLLSFWVGFHWKKRHQWLKRKRTHTSGNHSENVCFLPFVNSRAGEDLRMSQPRFLGCSGVGKGMNLSITGYVSL